MKLLIIFSLLMVFCFCQNPSQLWTYKLTQSSGSVNFFTASNSKKILRSDAVPTTTASGIHLESAKNEFEPFQIAIGPNSNLGSVAVSIDNFPNLGASQVITIDSLNYHATSTEWPEYLVTVNNGGSISIDNSRNNLIWVTVYVPPSAPAGYHNTNIRIGAYTIPVTLYVFNFALPTKYNFHSHLGASNTDDNLKQIYFNHRASPTGGPTWPSGFGYGVTYDTPSNGNNCNYFNDENTTEPNAAFRLSTIAPKWVKGQGWNGVGFTDTIWVQFVSNSQQRPSPFCGFNAVDNYGRSVAGTPNTYAELAALPYNAKWQSYCKGLRDYLANNGYLNKGYYYVQNEPQNQEDYDQAAFLSRLIKSVAPDLKIAISEEPKPGICENAKFGGAKYDIWIAHLVAFDLPNSKEYAQTRMKANPDEMLWLYSLEQDADPYYNPTRIDRQGMHVRIISWAGWKWRASGWGYYAMGQFFTGSKPNLRFELFRETSEDYEYLFMANGNKYPDFSSASPVDPMIETVASSLKTWNSDGDAHAKLRQELGLFLEGKRATMPTLQATCPNANPLKNYYINFQDPSQTIPGMDYNVWIKQGWGPDFNVDKSKGFTGSALSNTAVQKYSYIDDTSFSPQARSSLFDDYGKSFTFNWCLPNGKYNVTVSIGRATKAYGCCHYLEVEGSIWFNQATTVSQSILSRSSIVDLNDCCLTFSLGNNNEYTFLDFIMIEPVSSPTTTAPTPAPTTRAPTTAAPTTRAPTTTAPTTRAPTTTAPTTRAPTTTAPTTRAPTTAAPTTTAPTTRAPTTRAPTTTAPTTRAPTTAAPTTRAPTTTTPTTRAPTTAAPTTRAPTTTAPTTRAPTTAAPTTRAPTTTAPTTRAPTTAAPTTRAPTTTAPTTAAPTTKPPIRCVTKDDIINAINKAQAGDVILVDPGTYNFAEARVNIVNKPAATLRAASKNSVFFNFVNTANPSAVVEGFVLDNSSGWTFENIVIEGKCADPAYCDHAFHIVNSSDNLVFRNLNLINFNYQIKQNNAPNPSNFALVSGCTFYDRVIRPSHTYKINLSGSSGWNIRGNYFYQFSTNAYSSAVAASTVTSLIIDSNLIVASKVGTSFGVYLRDSNGVFQIVNNIIARTNDVGIYLERATAANIYNNIIYDTNGIDIRFSPSSAVIRNNIYNSAIRNRDSGTSTVGKNLEVADLATFNTYLVNPSANDFRLTAAGKLAAKGLGDNLSDLTKDYCQNTRAAPFDYGPYDLKSPDCASNLPIFVADPNRRVLSSSSTANSSNKTSSGDIALYVIIAVCALVAVVFVVVAVVLVSRRRQQNTTNNNLKEPLLNEK